MNNMGPWANPTLDQHMTSGVRTVLNAPCNNGVSFVPHVLLQLAGGHAAGGRINLDTFSEGQFPVGSWPMVRNFIMWVNAGGLNAPLPEPVAEVVPDANND